MEKMKAGVRKHGAKYEFAILAPADETGKRKQQWFTGYRTLKDAQSARRAELAKIDKQEYVAPTKTTTGAYLTGWLASIKRDVRPSTWASYELNIRRHVIPAIGAIPLQTLDPKRISTLYGDLLDHGRQDGEGLSYQSVRYIAMILRHALKQAIEDSALTVNPTNKAKRPPKPQSRMEMKTWSAAELRAFLDAIQTEPMYAPLVLAASTGMRRGEVLGLRWRDLDLDAARVAVTQTYIAIGYQVHFSPPKTAKGRRNVALDGRTVAVLREHRRTQVAGYVALGIRPDHDLVFTTALGEPIHPERLTRSFAQYVKAAGVPSIRLHDLRHTHATLALQAGIHAKHVSERLGHSTVAITLDTYSHAIPAMQEEAAERVAQLVFGS